MSGFMTGGMPGNTMQTPPMGGPQMGGSPGGGSPQIPPQVLQMLIQRMGGGQGGTPPGMPGQPSPQMQPPMGGMPGGGQMGAPPPIPQPGAAQQLAQQGRFGDSIVAHVTPGEISVPPQIQTPELLAALKQAFARAGVSLPQFTAGSPQTAHNPATGAPELSLWSALLPILGTVAGGLIGGIPTLGLGAPAGAAIGGGLGGAAGGAIDHQTPLGIGLSALGGAAGGYLGAPAEAVVGAAPAATAGAGGIGSDAAASALASGAGTAAPNAFAVPAAGSGVSGIGASLKSAMPYLKGGTYAGVGSALGGALAPPSVSDPLGAAGFKKPLPPLNPNFNALRGSGQVSTPQFAGYNPYAAVSGQNPGFNFFPQQ